MNESLSTVPVSGLKFLEVNRFIGFEHILADGAIGLGFGYTETDEEGSEPDTDFVEALVK